MYIVKYKSFESYFKLTFDSLHFYFQKFKADNSLVFFVLGNLQKAFQHCYFSEVFDFQKNSIFVTQKVSNFFRIKGVGGVFNVFFQWKIPSPSFVFWVQKETVLFVTTNLSDFLQSLWDTLIIVERTTSADLKKIKTDFSSVQKVCTRWKFLKWTLSKKSHCATLKNVLFFQRLVFFWILIK